MNLPAVFILIEIDN